MRKIDLHTHSTLSHDGGISERNYTKLLNNGVLDHIAITDHNEVDFALDLHKKLGDRIIVGEEIMSSRGEIIGLFLNKKIKSGLTPLKTVKEILDQDGSVYLPHPLMSVSGSISHDDALSIIEFTDRVIVEVFNARTRYFTKLTRAAKFAIEHNLAMAASSDTHGAKGVGSTYTLVQSKPQAGNLHNLIKNGTTHPRRATVRSLFYPKYNKVKKKINAISK